MKQRMIHRFAAGLSLLALTLGAAPAFAGPATDAVKVKQATLFNLIQQSTPDAQKKIDAVLDDMIDYQALARTSLGEEWAARSDAEKTQFTDLLTQLVRQAYQRSLKRIVSYDVQYVNEAPSGGGTMVTSKSISKTDPRADPIELGFDVQDRGGGKWKVVDILTEGESLAVGYRSQFGKIIKKDGFPAVITKMKARLAKPADP